MYLWAFGFLCGATFMWFIWTCADKFERDEPRPRRWIAYGEAGVANDPTGPHFTGGPPMSTGSDHGEGPWTGWGHIGMMTESPEEVAQDFGRTSESDKQDAVPVSETQKPTGLEGITASFQEEDGSLWCKFDDGRLMRVAIKREAGQSPFPATAPGLSFLFYKPPTPPEEKS